MTESAEINEFSQTLKRKPARSRLMALLVALLVAGAAVVAFSASTASAQTGNDNGDANQQQSDDSTDDSDDDSADDSDGTCDHDGAHRGGKHWRHGMSDTLAEVLGIDVETLRDQLKDGSTLADIAAEQEVEVDDVIDALVTAISERAAEHDREIDPAELTTKITAFVNGERPERPEGEDGRRARRGLQRGGVDGLRHGGGQANSDTAP